MMTEMGATHGCSCLWPHAKCELDTDEYLLIECCYFAGKPRLQLLSNKHAVKPSDRPTCTISENTIKPKMQLKYSLLTQ